MSEDHFYSPACDKIRQSFDKFSIFTKFLSTLKDKNGNKFNWDKDFDNTFYNPRSVRSRFTNLLRMSEKLLSIQKTDIIPTSYSSSLYTNITELDELLDQIITRITQNHSSYILDDTQATATSSIDNSTVQTTSQLISINNKIDSALNYAHLILSITVTKGYTPYTQSTDKITSLLSELDIAICKNNEQTEDIQSLHKSLMTTINKTIDESKIITSLLKTAEQHSTEIASFSNDSLTNKNEIEGIYNSALELQEEATKLQNNLSSFDTNLKKRNDEFIKGTSELNKLLEDLKHRQTDLSNLYAECEKLLSGATNSALASSFKTALDDTTNDLRKTQLAFYISISVLVILSIPLTLHIFIPQLIKSGTIQNAEALPFFISIFSSNGSSISTFIASIILVMPGIWLTRFNAAKHSSLFRLAEDYKYKYTIALSVEGYKKSAPTYKEEIAASAFYEITFNPANNIDKGHDQSAHPNPILTKFFDKIGVNHNGRPKETLKDKD